MKRRQHGEVRLCVPNTPSVATNCRAVIVSDWRAFSSVQAVHDDKSFYTRLGRLSAIITILPASMGAGWIVGYFLVDRVFGLFPWGSVVLTLLGAGAGFYEIVRLLMADREQ
jgi:hypothetical protein